MKKKRYIPKLVSAAVILSMSVGSFMPAGATQVIVDETVNEEEQTDQEQKPDGQQPSQSQDTDKDKKTDAEEEEKLDDQKNTADEKSNDGQADADEQQTVDDEDTEQQGSTEIKDSDEIIQKEIEVTYRQSSNYYVTIPKTISLGTDKKSSYSVKVEGDIAANKQVCVLPIDGIEDTPVLDFYMKDKTTGSSKEDVVAEISQSKFYWNYDEVLDGYEETDNFITAEGLSAGNWKGTFLVEISLRNDPSHIHNYVGEITKEPTCTEAGEKTYTCDCGDSYTEPIDPTGHHYVNGECEHCGEKDPNHEHKYTETITKEPTCTEDGEKTYTCDCGDTKTEVIPATGHHYVDGECEHCGEKDPSHEHKYTETVTKKPTCTEAGEKTLTCDCGDTKTEVIPATEHNWEPLVVSIDPAVTMNPNTAYSSYTFTKSSSGGKDSYRGRVGIVSRQSGSSSMSMAITLPEDYEGTYMLPITYSISSSSFTKSGYSLTVQILDYYNYDESDKYGASAIPLNYGISYTSTSTGTTYGTVNVELHPGKNVLNFSMSARTNLANYQTGAQGGPEANVTFSMQQMPFDIVDGTETHRCSICKTEVSHREQLYEVERKEPTCMEEGYIRYTCDECGFIYDEILPINSDNHTDKDNDLVCDLCGERFESNLYYLGTGTSFTVKNTITDGYASLNANNFIVGLVSFPSMQSTLTGTPPHYSQYISAGDGGSTLSKSYNSSTSVFTTNKYTYLVAQKAGSAVLATANTEGSPLVYAVDGKIVDGSKGNITLTNQCNKVYKLRVLNSSASSVEIDMSDYITDEGYKALGADDFIVVATDMGNYTGSTTALTNESSLNLSAGTYTKQSGFSIKKSYDPESGILTVSNFANTLTFTDNRGVVYREAKPATTLEIYLYHKVH